MTIIISKKHLAIGLVLVIALIAAQGARAANGGTIYACVNARGIPRMVEEGEDCLAAETALQWNDQGIPGPEGPQGPPGPQGEQGPQGPSGMRQFYLTTELYRPSETIEACIDGYHFASQWELLDPSGLKYNTALGLTLEDSGQGPPAYQYGWIRTGEWGWVESHCSLWTDDWGGSGTVLWLHDYPMVMTQQWACDDVWHVWCVQD